MEARRLTGVESSAGGPEHPTPPLNLRRAGWRSWAVAVLSVAAAAAIGFSLKPITGGEYASITFFLFFAAIAIAGITGGLDRAVLALFLGALASWLLFTQPRQSPSRDPATRAGLILYLLTGAGIAVLASAARRDHLRAIAASGEAAARSEQLEREIAARGRAEEAWHRARQIALHQTAEEKWTRDEARYRTPFDEIKGYGIMMLDPTGRTASWNQGIERLLGHTKSEFVGKSVSHLFILEDQLAGVLEKDLADAAEHGRVAHERWLVRKDGTRFWASESTISVHDEQGQLVGFVKKLRDLSESKQAEEELRRNQEALELAHEAAGLGTWDYDLVTGEIRWDNRAKQLFGLPADVTLTYETWVEALHPDDRGPIEELWRRALQEHTPYSAEHRVIWPDGSTHWIAVLGRSTDDPASGEPLRMRGVMVDITARKRTEERLQEALRLEAVGRLAGGIAHDLNNMLAAILGFSDFLSQSLAPNDPLQADVEQIAHAATRSTSLTRQLLAFARRELIQPRRFNLNSVVQRAAGMLRPGLGENVEFTVRFSPSAGIIFADPGRVEQILMNLVLNARDAMPQGGRVTVETTLTTLESGSAARHPDAEIPPGRYVVLSVTDTGHGMEAATLLRIWEPFFTTKPAGEGTGLGLSVVYGSVKQSGGFVWADSEPNKGTVIQIYWPEVGIAVEAPSEGAPLTAVAGGSESVLIVEDEPVLRALTKRTLDSRGYQCMDVGSGDEALALLQRRDVHVDLVITDVVMPGMSGGSLGERLALLRPGVPVLYMSGFADDDVIRRGLLDSGRPFLQKPFSPHDLARTVREVLNAAVAAE